MLLLVQAIDSLQATLAKRRGYTLLEAHPHEDSVLRGRLASTIFCLGCKKTLQTRA